MPEVILIGVLAFGGIAGGLEAAQRVQPYSQVLYYEQPGAFEPSVCRPIDDTKPIIRNLNQPHHGRRYILSKGDVCSTH